MINVFVILFVLKYLEMHHLICLRAQKHYKINDHVHAMHYYRLSRHHITDQTKVNQKGIAHSSGQNSLIYDVVL